MTVNSDGTLHADDYRRIADLGELVKDILDNSDYSVLNPDRLDDLEYEMEGLLKRMRN